MVDPGTRHTICTRHLVDYLHLHRRQFQIHVIHPGKSNLSRPKIKEELARKFNVANKQTIFISGFQTKPPFSKGFGIIYDNIEDELKQEPTHRLTQNGLKSYVVKNTKESITREKIFVVLKPQTKTKIVRQNMVEVDAFFQHCLDLHIFPHFEHNHILLVIWNVHIFTFLHVIQYISFMYII